MNKQLIAAVAGLWLALGVGGAWGQDVPNIGALTPNTPRIDLSPGASPVLVQDGDSLFATDGSETSPALTTLDFALQTFTKQIYWHNVSLGGRTMSTLVSIFPTNVAPFYKPNETKFVVHVIGGGNDIRASKTAAQIFASLQQYVNLVHALGSNAVVAVATTPLQCDVLGNPTWLSALQTYNGLIQAGWNVSQASGGLGADALIDYFANPTIGMNTYASSAFCDSTYSNTIPPGQHLNNLGKSIMGPIESPVIMSLIP